MRISSTGLKNIISQQYPRPWYNDNSDKLNEKIFQSNKDNISNNFDHVHSYFI